MQVNIAILNYNGKELLRECLPSIIEAASLSVYKPTVTVLDNCSRDESCEVLKKEFPQVIIYHAQENKVYCSYNQFFADCDDDVILILNSDIKVDKQFLDPLIVHFERDSSVFFVSSRMYYFDGVTYQGDRAKAVERFGAISADTRFPGYEALIEQKGFTFSTGNGAFDRKKFLELDGFDDLYLPGRYEDVDFCFRGWKSGYRGVYEPKSIIYHKGYASFKAVFNDAQIQRDVFRNSILFMWKNIDDKILLLRFHLWLLARLVFFLITLRFHFLSGFSQALMRLRTVIVKRNAADKNFLLSDKEVFKIVG